MARHLFGPAGAMFDEPAWVALGGDAGAWEAAWWGLDARPHAAVRAPALASRLFPDAGIAVDARRRAAHYLLVTNGIVGTNGFGNHKHNDLLSFEYHHGGAPLIVDPGSYVYTSDVDARNRFRGTASHNTVHGRRRRAERTAARLAVPPVRDVERRSHVVVRRRDATSSNTSAGITATSGCRSR